MGKQNRRRQAEKVNHALATGRYYGSYSEIGPGAKHAAKRLAAARKASAQRLANA